MPYLRRWNGRGACPDRYSHNPGVYEQVMNSSCELHVASFPIARADKSKQDFREFMKAEFDRMDKNCTGAVPGGLFQSRKVVSE